MIYKNLPILAIFSLLSALSVKSQELTIDGILGKVESYYRNNPIEKVYLHHPKDQYAKGEKLWFSAYLFDGMTNQPSQSSRIVYTELIHQETREIYRNKVKISRGKGNGYFELSDTLRSGAYLLRGYTYYMRNFGEKFFFYDRVLITDSHNSKVIPGLSTNDISSIEFFPEGGNLVSGVANRVAFKAINMQGNGVQFSGSLKDAEGNEVAILESDNRGLGSIFFSPKQTKYSAEIQGKNFEFPTVKSSGVNLLTYINASDQLVINVQPNKAYLRDSKSQKFLIIQSADYTVLTVEPDLKRRGFVASIPRSDLPDGLLNIALVNSNGVLEAERLFFNPPKMVNLSVTSDKSGYQRREKVTITLEAKKGAVPVQGRFSIAVSDKRQSLFENSNLASYLELFSELNGFVEEPLRYSDFNDPETIKRLDNLLLTSRWNKFDWQEILEDKLLSQPFNNEKFLWLRGKVYQTGSDAPIVDKRVAVMLVDKELMMEYGTDEQGDFYVPFPDFTGADNAFISFEDWKKDEMAFTIEKSYGVDESVMNQFPKTVISDNQASPGLHSILTSFNFYQEDKTGQDTSEAEVTNEKYAHEDDQVIYLDDFVKLNSVLEILKEIIPGVSIKNPNRKEVEARVFSTELAANFEGAPLFVVDGIPTYDTDFIFSLDPSMIASIGVIRSFQAIEKYGTIAQNGIIEITSRSGNFGSNLSATIVKYQGFGEELSFESPDYSSGSGSTRIPDLRHILYWNPEVTTDSNGKATVEFYASDLITDYEITVEGANAENGAGSVSTTLSVEVSN